MRTVNIQRLQYLRDIRRRGDERDGVHPHILQPPQGIRQFARREGASGIAVADVSVLAVGAAERTAGEEHRARAVLAGNRRFFPEVRRDSGDAHGGWQLAEAVARGFIALGAAGARAEGALHKGTSLADGLH